MAITTVVVWNPLSTAEDHAIMTNKAEEMKVAGKTDGTVTVVQEMLGSTVPRNVTRTWNTIEAAQEWIDFVTPFSPASAVINQ
jgi:hypothetical protein